MITGRTLDIENCVRVLKKNPDIKFINKRVQSGLNPMQSTIITYISIKENHANIGNKSWGRIDYLKKQGFKLKFN